MASDTGPDLLWEVADLNGFSVPTWFQAPQDKDWPANFNRRNPWRCVMTSEDMKSKVEVKMQISLDSQFPKVHLFVDDRCNGEVVFPAADCSFDYGFEGEESPFTEAIRTARMSPLNPFKHYDYYCNGWKPWQRAMAIKLAVFQAPTIIGFPGPDSEAPRTQAMKDAWEALKSIGPGKDVNLWMEMETDSGAANVQRGMCEWFIRLTRLAYQSNGGFWYRKLYSPNDMNRPPPAWLWANHNKQRLYKYKPSDPFFVSHHDRIYRLVDATCLEKCEQIRKFTEVFNKDRTHKAMIESQGKIHHIFVKVVNEGRFVHLPESTRVSFVLQDDPLDYDYGPQNQQRGIVIASDSDFDFVLEYDGDLPPLKNPVRTFITLDVWVDTTPADAQMEALKKASKPCVFGDTPQGRSHGFSLMKMVLAHQVELDPKSSLYFELSLKDLSPLPATEAVQRYALFRKMFFARLDESQKEAVNFSVDTIRCGLSLIIGPPGTEKTVTAAFIIMIAMYLKIQVLITASSNTAVDNLTAAVVKLLKQSTYIARDCGQIIRFRTEKAQIAAFRAQSATRNYLLRRDSSFFNPDTLQHEAHVLVRNYMRSHPSQESCRDLSALDALDTDRGLDSREYGLFQKAYQEVLTLVLQESRVVASTLSNSGNLVLRSVQGFQPALILSDEAGQSLEGEAMIGLTTPSLRAVVLIGDPFQLPPTVLSEHAKNEWAHFLKRSLLERLRDARYPATQLRLNYRNHPDILRFFNDRVYHGTLIPHQANTNPRKVGPSGVVFDEWMHQISRRFGGHYDDLVGQRRIWVDVEGLATKESMGTSWENLAQVQAVRRILAGLFKVANGRIGLEDMMIITPYRAQLKRCRDELKLQGLAPHDIFTVDAAQGREANIVVILLTKPSAEGRGAIQFVADKARLNVALSRARQVCLVVGDLQAFTHVFHNSGGGGGNPTKFLEQLFEDVTGRNHVLPLDAVEDVEVVSQ